MPRDLLDGENDLREVLIASGLHGLSFRFVDGRRAEDWKVVHPRLDTGCALCSDWKADLSRPAGGAVAGTAYTEAPTTTQSMRLEFRADFSAVVAVAKTIADPGGTPAQREGRARLREMGMKFTPADFLVSRTNPEAVALFLKGGMPADEPLPGNGETLLLETLGSSAEDPEVNQVAKLLIAAGADPNKIADNGEAVTFEYPEVVRLLLRRGIAATADALWFAIMDPDEEKVRLLLEAGVSPNLRRDTVGDTPLLFAVTMSPARGEAAGEAALTGIIHALIAHGADVNAADTATDATPLLQAAQYCPPDIVRALIKAGARLKTAAQAAEIDERF